MARYFIFLFNLLYIYMYNSLFMYDILHTLIVSYHGTANNNCKNIAEEGYLLCKGRRFAFGHGIYSSPDIDVAYRYAPRFSHEEENYRIVIQNRVNPKNMVRISKQETGIGEYWISPKQADLRPYGICLKKD